jgi:hypothetical protein
MGERTSEWNTDGGTEGREKKRVEDYYTIISKGGFG